MTPTLQQIEAEAAALLAEATDPSVRVRLLRDVLRVRPRDRELRFALRDLNLSPPVQALWTEQQDGSWGRFHSRDSRAQKKIGTTESGVARALKLGLTVQHPLLRRAKGYLERLLAMRVPFPDPPEKNPRWQTGWRLFTAATLARLSPNHWAIDPMFDLWSEIARRTFARGRYDAAAELAAHRELTGIDGDLRYLHINNTYVLTLLGVRSADVPTKTQRALLRWLISREQAMIYLPVNLRRAPSIARLPDVLRAVEIVSAFSEWRGEARRLVTSLDSLPRTRLQIDTHAKLLSLLRRYIR